MTRPRLITVGSVLVAAIVVAVVLTVVNRDHKPPLLKHTPIAPAAKQAPRPNGTVVGTDEQPNQVAVEAIEGTRAAFGVRPDLTPLAPKAFAAPIASYRSYSVRQARALATDVRALRGALAGGDRAAAKRAWAAAYDHYLLIGAAYGALGDLDVAIDGGPGSLPGGVDDPKFSGLHRIEYMLWTGKPLASVAPWAAKLQADVAKLPSALRDAELDPLTYATRSHEILEDAQRDMLSGRAARWSGAGVAATDDGLKATKVVVGTLARVLAGRGDVQQQVDYRLSGLQRQLDALKRAHHGALPTLAQLTPTQRQRLNGSVGASLEALAGLPGALETSLPPVIPKLPQPKRR